jgi:hypothetical protein
MYFVGIDWADQKHTFVVTNDYAEELAAFEVPHSFAGLMEFKERLASIGITPSEAACFIETSRGLLVSFLLEHGFVVYPLNPKVVDKHRKPSGAKTEGLSIFLCKLPHGIYQLIYGSNRSAKYIES